MLLMLDFGDFVTPTLKGFRNDCQKANHFLSRIFGPTFCKGLGLSDLCWKFGLFFVLFLGGRCFILSQREELRFACVRLETKMAWDWCQVVYHRSHACTPRFTNWCAHLVKYSPTAWKRHSWTACASRWLKNFTKCLIALSRPPPSPLYNVVNNGLYKRRGIKKNMCSQHCTKGRGRSEKKTQNQKPAKPNWKLSFVGGCSNTASLLNCANKS